MRITNANLPRHERSELIMKMRFGVLGFCIAHWGKVHLPTLFRVALMMNQYFTPTADQIESARNFQCQR